MIKKRITTFIDRWRRRPATSATPIATATDETKTVEIIPEPSLRADRNFTPVIIVAIVAITLLILLAIAFMPGLRETRIAHTIRFWDPALPPAPAVPPGQLAVDVQQAHAENPTGTVMIDPATAESMGLQTFTVEARSLDQPVRTTGRVAVDERHVTQVHTKVDGFIEQTFGNFEGQQIRQGQPLFTIYSPDLVATEQEYLIALRARGDFVKSEFEVVRRSGTTLVDATRRRLQLWDVTPGQIKEIERTGRFSRTVTFYAPASGVVTQRTAFPGMRITPDTQLYTLADLSGVWVEADVYETDLSNIRLGTSAEVTLPSGETRTGRVAYINPFVAPETRTAQVRLELSNPGLRLKPGMFVNVSLRTVQPPQVIVPRDSVLATGTRNLVLVDDGKGRFTLREITIGTQAQEGFYTVQSGVSVGDRVARNIQFLIESSAELKQTVEGQSGAPISPGGAKGGGMQGMPGMPGMK